MICFLKRPPWRQNLLAKGEIYGKSEDVSEKGYQKSSGEDCGKEDGSKGDRKENSRGEEGEQVLMRSLRPRRYC